MSGVLAIMDIEKLGELEIGELVWGWARGCVLVMEGRLLNG
jgi:hypothetical protein